MNEVSLWCQPVTEALGFTVFHGLWQGALLYLSVQSLLWFFKISKQRYRVLYVAFCMLFVSFAITFCIEWKDALQRQQKTEMVVATAILTQNKDHELLAATVQHYNKWQDFTNFYQHPGFKHVLPFISLFYLIGIFILTARLLTGVGNMRLLRQRLIPVPDELQQRFPHLLQLVAIRRKVGLFFSEKVNVPLMIGHLKPLIILPVALASRLDMQQTEAVLLHELAHIKRMDYLFNLLQSVMELFLFFNPVTWWFAVAIRKERELCCDDLVIEHATAPVKYAEALFQLELGRGNTLPALAATGNNKKHTLLTRIKRIIEMKPNTKRTPQGIFAALTCLLLLVAIGCYYTAAAQGKKQPEQKVIHKEIVVKKQSQNTTDDATEADSIVNNAMNAAQSAISQINWDDVKDAMQQTGDEIDQVDKQAVEHALAKANVEIKNVQTQLQNMDWSVVSNSLGSAEKAIASIDWDEISNQMTDAVQSADMPDNTVRNAMQQARIALDSVRTAMHGAGMDSKKIADSILRSRRQVADSISVIMQRMTTEVLRNRRAARDKAHASLEQAMSAVNAKRDEARSEAKRIRAMMSAQQNGQRINTVNTDGLISQLESDKKIDRNKKFKINYEDGMLEVNGKVVPAAAYRKYLPAGKNTTLKIAGKKGSLSVSTIEHD